MIIVRNIFMRTQLLLNVYLVLLGVMNVLMGLWMTVWRVILSIIEY